MERNRNEGSKRREALRVHRAKASAEAFRRKNEAGRSGRQVNSGGRRCFDCGSDQHLAGSKECRNRGKGRNGSKEDCCHIFSPASEQYIYAVVSPEEYEQFADEFQSRSDSEGSEDDGVFAAVEDK